jgi:hypothetical protein
MLVVARSGFSDSTDFGPLRTPCGCSWPQSYLSPAAVLPVKRQMACILIDEEDVPRAWVAIGAAIVGEAWVVARALMRDQASVRLPSTYPQSKFDALCEVTH